MENNILSLFDEDNVPAQPNNKKQGGKKKASKKSQTTNNSLFSFDAVETDENHTNALQETSPELLSAANVADNVTRITIQDENSNAITNETDTNATNDTNADHTEIEAATADTTPTETSDLFTVVDEGALPIDTHNDYDGIDIIVDVIPTVVEAPIDPIVDELPTIAIDEIGEVKIPDPIVTLPEVTIDPIIDELPTIDVNEIGTIKIEDPIAAIPATVTIDPIVDELPTIDISEIDAVTTDTPNVSENEATTEPVIETLPSEDNATAQPQDETIQVVDQNTIDDIKTVLKAAKRAPKNPKAEPLKQKQKISALHKALDEAAGQQQLFHSADSVKYESLKFEIAEPEPPVQSLPEWKLTKKYYTIGEVAQLFEVNTSHIRFWTKEFNFKLRTNRKGDRMYTPIDIDKLRMVHELVKVKRHTLKGAKDIINNKKINLAKNITLKDNLTVLKELLINIRASL